MVLVDTSVWTAHFHKRQPPLAKLLDEGLALGHPFVTGELACGHPRRRPSVLAYLAARPAAKRATDAEAMHLVDDRALWGRGLGWVDAHLLASALVSRCRFWTLDKRLAKADAELDSWCNPDRLAG